MILPMESQIIPQSILFAEIMFCHFLTTTDTTQKYLSGILIITDSQKIKKIFYLSIHLLATPYQE